MSWRESIRHSEHSFCRHGSHASIQSTEIYLRADPTEKLDALAMGIPPTLKRGKFQVPDKLMAMFKEAGKAG